MVKNVKAGDKVFVVRDYYVANGNYYNGVASEFSVEIEEKNIFAIIDFGKCKKIAFEDDGYSIDGYLLEDKATKIFTNYDDALKCAKDLVCEHFIKDSTGRGKNDD